MMTLNRRQFAQSLGAAVVLLPFLQQRSRAASSSGGPPRLVFITSLGTSYASWVPQSAPGAPVVLGASCAAMQSVLNDVVFVGGLPAPYTGENHGTAQHTTGIDFGHQGLKTSVETYIAQQLAPTTKLPSLLLGAAASGGSNFWKSGTILPVIDSPLDAFNFATGNTTSTANGFAPPRAQILDLVQAQIKTLQGSLGASEKQKLEQHLQNVSQLETSITATVPASAACGNAAAPNTGGADPENQANTASMGMLQMGVAATMLSCDVTRIIGMQWGTTGNQVINIPGFSGDEHGSVHSLPGSQNMLVAQENYLSSAFASLVAQLKATADPLSPGQTLLDNTLIMWTHDIGDGTDHTQTQVPIVLAGATSYLKRNASGGTYYNLAGHGTTLNVLLNMIEYMGAPLGSFGSTNGPQTGAPLSALKV